MPQVVTGFEPTDPGWSLIADKIYARGAPTDPAFVTYQDVRVISVAGFDLWGGLGDIDGVHAGLSQHGMWIYYLSIWRNPPSFLGTGFDDYRAVAVHK